MPRLRNSQPATTAVARSAAAGTSTMTPAFGSPAMRAIWAKAAASPGVDTIGAITHTSVSPAATEARAMARSWSSSSSGKRREVRRPRMPSAGFGSSGWVTNPSGLSAPASSVRTTTLRPLNALKTRV